MTPMRSVAEPIYTARTALIGSSGVPKSWMPGLNWTLRPNRLRTGSGLAGCGCGPVGGCGCAPGLQGMGQSSLDQIIANAANWLGGFAQSQLPPSAAVPPQYGSSGAVVTQLTQWIPWIIGGYLLYMFIK
jgi:hypothetical protein